MVAKRRFSKEFKAEAVAMVKQSGMTVCLAAKDLGISQSALRNWYKQGKLDIGVKKGPDSWTTAEKEELASLRKQNRILTMEREILKKAAFFAKESN